jgi:glycosyltransferase involved in cell wall biosynthesis
MNVCMILYRVMPQDNRRLVVAQSIRKKYGSVDIFCIRQDGQQKYEESDGLIYHRIPVNYSKDDNALTQILKYSAYTFLCSASLLKCGLYKRYNIIHVHNPPDFILVAALPMKLLFNTKIILDLHDMLPESVASNFNKSENHFIVKIAKLVERFAIFFSDSIICTNDYDKDIVLSRNHISPGKISVVMNSPNLTLFPIEHATKEQYQLENRFVILFEGTIWKRRGIQTVIESLNLLKEKIPVYFIVVGDGPDIQYLIDIVELKGLSDYVLFTGWVDLKLVSQYISLADLCIIPFMNTKVNERGVPNKLFEYIVHDKPVISSRLKGIALTFNEDQVIFFEPGNPGDLAKKIEWCYNNPEETKKMVISAKNRFFNEYNWEKMESTLYQSYDNLINVEESE